MKSSARRHFDPRCRLLDMFAPLCIRARGPEREGIGLTSRGDAWTVEQSVEQKAGASSCTGCFTELTGSATFHLFLLSASLDSGTAGLSSGFPLLHHWLPGWIHTNSQGFRVPDFPPATASGRGAGACPGDPLAGAPGLFFGA